MEKKLLSGSMCSKSCYLWSVYSNVLSSWPVSLNLWNAWVLSMGIDGQRWSVSIMDKCRCIYRYCPLQNCPYTRQSPCLWRLHSYSSSSSIFLITRTFTSSGDPLSLIKNFTAWSPGVLYFLLFLQESCFFGYICILLGQVLINIDVWPLQLFSLFQ